MEQQSGTVSAHLDGNVLEMLKNIAAEEDRSISWLVGFAVKQLIHERVKKQDAALGAQRQVHLEDAIVSAVKAGPVTTTERQAQHRKNLASRAARMADRTTKRK